MTRQGRIHNDTLKGDIKKGRHEHDTLKGH